MLKEEIKCTYVYTKYIGAPKHCGLLIKSFAWIGDR